MGPDQSTKNMWKRSGITLVVFATCALASPIYDEESRTLDSLGGGNILRETGYDRSLDSLGGGHILRQLDSLGGGNILREVPQQFRLYGAPSKRGFDPMSGMTFGMSKKNFDEIDRAGFGRFVKKNFDEIDRAGFGRFVKKNFDEIDRAGFGSLVKRPHQ